MDGHKKNYNVSLKLSEGDTMRLLRLYRGEPCLYDVNDSGYGSREMRAAASKRIANALAINGFGPKEVTTKFKNLRNSYSQEMKKLKYNNWEMDGGTDVDASSYEPKVYWFDLMDSYLRPFLYYRSREQQPRQPTKATASTSKNVKYQKPIEKLRERLPKQIKIEAVIKDPLEIPTRTVPNKCDTGRPSRPTAKRKMPDVAERDGEQNDLDEPEVVGMNVAKKLSRMDPTQAVYAESLIHQVLMKGLLNQLSAETFLHDSSEDAEEPDTFNAPALNFKYKTRCASPIVSETLSSDEEIR